MSTRIIVGDALEVLRTLPEASHQCCVTSPPYFGLRDYGVEGQIGLEEDPAAYIARLVEVFREMRRVLRDDGTLWLNMGDSYAGSWGAQAKRVTPAQEGWKNSITNHPKRARTGSTTHLSGIKPKDLFGMPWMLAFALRADGWWLRSSIVWAKPNPMPESIRDRPTSAHELVFLLSKRPRYFYDAEAIKEDALTEEWPGIGPQHAAERDRGEAYKPMRVPTGWDTGAGHHGTIHRSGRRKDLRSDTEARHRSRIAGGQSLQAQPTAKRNARNVWTIATQPFAGAHFATMPPALVERCIKAGTSARGGCPHCGAPWERALDRRLVPTSKVSYGTKPDARDASADRLDHGSNRVRDGHVPGMASANETTGWHPTCRCPAHEPVPQMVLDPFGGAGTTGLVAIEPQRSATLIELNPDYAEMARRRIGLFAEVA